MTAQLYKILTPSLNKFLSEKYQINRIDIQYDKLILEIRNIEKELVESVKSKDRSNVEIYFYGNSKTELFDALLLGNLKSIEMFAGLNDELIKSSTLNAINNFREYDNLKLEINDNFLPNRKSYVMGILNVTPDSFSDGGKYFDVNSAVAHALKMINIGADIIDVGGESTRPGAERVSTDEELKRVIPVISKIKKIMPESIISIDTTKAQVASQAIEAGAEIVNDISGLTFDAGMADVIAGNNVFTVLMHIKGNPKTMQDNPNYADSVSEIYDYLAGRIEFARNKNIYKIILDPGIGFGKRVNDNFEIISRLEEFKSLGYPILIGLSKKSFIGKSLKLNLDMRDDATLTAETIAVQNGAKIIRTHNVNKAVEARKLMNFITNPELSVSV